MREFWDTFIEPWEDVNIEIEEIRDAGDSVLALVVFHARARDGLEIDQPFVHVITFRGSRGIRFEAFRSVSCSRRSKPPACRISSLGPAAGSPSQPRCAKTPKTPCSAAQPPQEISRDPAVC